MRHEPSPGETPLGHFKSCGPFCTHISFCADCVNVFGFCNKPGCDGLPKWEQGTDPIDNPCIEPSNN